jgi:hypothetical protein
MTVAELIEKLSKLNPDINVYACDYEDEPFLIFHDVEKVIYRKGDIGLRECALMCFHTSWEAVEDINNDSR